MALIIKSADLSRSVASQGGPKRQTHTRARPLTGIDMSSSVRLRVGHMLTLFSISHSTLYTRMAAGQIPKPDGRDGKRPYWSAAKVQVFLLADER